MPLYIVLVLVLGVLGICNTVYLSYHAVTKTPVRCVFFPAEWCQKVQFSSYSKTFGIPNPYAGLAMYLAIVVLTLTYLAGLTPFAIVAGVIAVGMLFSLYFLFIQAFVLKAFCTWCVVSAAEFLLLTLAVAFLS